MQQIGFIYKGVQNEDKKSKPNQKTTEEKKSEPNRTEQVITKEETKSRRWKKRNQIRHVYGKMSTKSDKKQSNRGTQIDQKQSYAEKTEANKSNEGRSIYIGWTKI